MALYIISENQKIRKMRHIEYLHEIIGMPCQNYESKSGFTQSQPNCYGVMPSDAVLLSRSFMKLLSAGIGASFLRQLFALICVFGFTCLTHMS